MGRGGGGGGCQDIFWKGLAGFSTGLLIDIITHRRISFLQKDREEEHQHRTALQLNLPVYLVVSISSMKPKAQTTSNPNV